jgi:hypothetical protein
MLFSLAVSWRFACLIAIVIAPAKAARPPGEGSLRRGFLFQASRLAVMTCLKSKRFSNALG